MKKRILIFIDWFFPGYKAGGPIQSCVGLIDRLKTYFDFSVVTRNTDLWEKTPYPNVPSNQWTYLPNGVRIYYFSKSNLKIKNIKQLLIDEDFDVLYLNSVFSFYFTIIPLMICYRLEKHFSIVLAPRGMLFPESLSKKWLKKKIFIFAAKSFGLFKNVIWHAANDNEQDVILNFFGPSTEVIIASPMPSIRQRVYVLKEKKPGELKMVYLSRIHRQKNLLGGLQYLKNISDDQSVQFDIYGPVDDHTFWEDCQRMIKTLPKHVRVTYHGDVDHNRVSQILSQYHFMILLTHRESFGHAILEALATGCPVITSDRTPWKNLKDQKAGWEVSLEKNDEVLQIVERCISMDQNEYNTWSKGAFEYAQKFFNDPEIIQKNKGLFANV